MPLTSKGEKIERAFKREYGSKEGERNFYASRNAGTISGVDRGINLGSRNPTIKGRDTFKGTRGNDINTNSFVPGGKRR